MKCILCHSCNTVSSYICQGYQLTQIWNRNFGVDISEEKASSLPIYRWLCNNCDLCFYDPTLAGSQSIYSQLSERKFYYAANKWEHRCAIKYASRRDRVLEIGCGSGHYLEMIKNERDACAVGMEMNPKAIDKATAKGLHIHKGTLEHYAITERETFDMVCHFQVLEHVPDPYSFLSSGLSLLRSKGLMIVGVPNGSGYLKYDSMNCLNMPPHHISQFSSRALKNIVNLFGLELVDLVYEPLAIEHVDYYCRAQIDRIPRIRYLTWPLIGPLRKFLPKLLQIHGIRYWLKGHSQLVVYRKK